MDQKLATKRKISSQTQNSFFITEQQIQRGYLRGYFTKSQGPAVSTEDQGQRGASYVFGKIGSPGRVRSPMKQGFGAVEAGPLFLVPLCVSSPLPVCLQTTILMKIKERVHNLKEIVVDLHHRDFYIFGNSY